MTSVLASVVPKVGDVYLITAGLIHAIGAGCTIVEIQEPTDFTIQPERWCGDYHISYEEEYIGLPKSVALDCFNFDYYGEKALKLAKKVPVTVYDGEYLKSEQLISYEDTPCFALNRYTLKGGGVRLTDGPTVVIVAEGEAVLSSGDRVKKGDYFFLPYAASGLIATGNAVLLECLPSKQDAPLA